MNKIVYFKDQKLENKISKLKKSLSSIVLEYKDEEYFKEVLLHQKEFEKTLDSIHLVKDKEKLLSKLEEILGNDPDINEIEECFVYTILYGIIKEQLYELDSKELIYALIENDIPIEKYKTYLKLITNKVYRDKLNITDDFDRKKDIISSIIADYEEGLGTLDNVVLENTESYESDEKLIDLNGILSLKIIYNYLKYQMDMANQIFHIYTEDDYNRLNSILNLARYEDTELLKYYEIIRKINEKVNTLKRKVEMILDLSEILDKNDMAIYEDINNLYIYAINGEYESKVIK